MEFPEKERIDGVFKYFGEFGKFAGMAKIILSHVAKVLFKHLLLLQFIRQRLRRSSSIYTYVHILLNLSRMKRTCEFHATSFKITWLRPHARKRFRACYLEEESRNCRLASNLSLSGNAVGIPRPKANDLICSASAQCTVRIERHEQRR